MRAEADRRPGRRRGRPESTSTRVQPAPDVAEARRPAAARSPRRWRTFQSALPAGEVLGVRRLGDQPRPAALTAATLPAPPHWATSRPPGLSTRAGCGTAGRGRRSSGRSPSRATASTCSPRSSSSRSAGGRRSPPAAGARACSTIEGAASTAIDAPARQPLEQQPRSRGRCRSRRRARSRRPRARAGRARRAPSRPAARDPLVGRGVPFARHTSVRYHVRSTTAITSSARALDELARPRRRSGATSPST